MSQVVLEVWEVRIWRMSQVVWEVWEVRRRSWTSACATARKSRGRTLRGSLRSGGSTRRSSSDFAAPALLTHRLLTHG